MSERPLLLLPRIGPSLRRVPQRNFPQEHLKLPSRENLAERFTSRFESMIESFVAGTPDSTSPENILVLETVGRIEDFRNAASKIPGLEWQAEVDIDDIESDDAYYQKPKIGPHFFKGKITEFNANDSKRIQRSLTDKGIIDGDGYLAEDTTARNIGSAVPEEYQAHKEKIVETIDKERRKPVSGRMYLSLSNRQALDQVKRLFDATQSGEDAPQLTFVWKNLFSHLKNVRFWDVEDRIRDTGVVSYWEREVALKKGTSSSISFEVELSFTDADQSRIERQHLIEKIVADEGGSVLAVCLIPEIRFHALKVDLPVDSIEKVLSKNYGALFRSGGVIFFRPDAQCCSEQIPDGTLDHVDKIEPPNAPPVIALLDGMPMVNHSLLTDFLVVDDPDSFGDDYDFNEAKHGTAMASLICHGELDALEQPIDRKIYVRPVLKPEGFSNRLERIPDRVFFEDLIERAVRRIFEGDQDEPAAAPTVRIINLSIADPDRVFHHFPGPTARLIDWLSYKYNVLFCVCAGNYVSEINLGVDAEEFGDLNDEEKVTTTLAAINANKRNRRIFSPAESINAITIGALHDDMSGEFASGSRFDVLPECTLPSPISTLGHGFRSSIKPEIFFPGGRQLYQFIGDGTYETSTFPHGPGQKVATSPVNSGERTRTVYTRGTSNATALASRSAGLIYSALEQLFDERGEEVPDKSIAPLLKAMLVHGASWGISSNIISSHLGLVGFDKKRECSRFVGYGIPDIGKSLECSANRATAIGFGIIKKDQRHEFRYPLPVSLSGLNVWRKLTITLAWLSPIGAENRKYRRAALTFEPKGLDSKIGGARSEAQWQQVKNGTVQHEIFEGSKVVAFLQQDEIVIPVQCREDAGALDAEVPYGIAVSLEVKEDVEIPIYDEVRDAIEIPTRIRLENQTP